MNVILDANIYCADYTLRSAQFKILLDYLKKTNSSVILPEIVLDELIACYRRKLQEKVKTACDCANELNRLLVDLEIPVVAFSLEEQLEKYKQFLLRKLHTSADGIPKHSEEDYRESVRRAVNHQKPCADGREEVKDTLLWLRVLSLAECSDNRTMVFVSSNSKDFGPGESLHPDLATEAKARDVDVKYFSSLDKFCKLQANKVTAITDELLKTKFELGAMETEMMNTISTDGMDRVLESVQSKLSRDNSVQSALPYSILLDLYEYYVYEQMDGSLLVVVTLTGDVLVDVSVADPEHGHLGWTRSRDFCLSITVESSALFRDDQVSEKEIRYWQIDDVEESKH